jgi:hypothetical protein
MIDPVEVDGSTYRIRPVSSDPANCVAIFEYEDSGSWRVLKFDYTVSLIEDLKSLMGLDVEKELHRVLTEEFKTQIRKYKDETAMKKLPRAFRPLKAEYVAIGNIIKDDKYLFMTEHEFVSMVIEETGGSASVTRCRMAYKNLMDEAGLTGDFQ